MKSREDIFYWREINENSVLRGLVKALPIGKPRQFKLEDVVARIGRRVRIWGLGSASSKGRILDLGCGTGDSIELLTSEFKDFEYLGIDIEESPEVSRRTRSGDSFETFDGGNIPRQDGFFDVVYSRQVFEHVGHPHELLAEVFRVLVPGGWFIGSVSNLEPYHSRSIFNFTPFGLAWALSRPGFSLDFVAPGIDGIALVHRSLNLRRAPSSVWDLSPLNAEIISSGLARRLKYYKMLKFAGHIIFVARKPNA